jgi:hypothetical protein
VPEVAIICDEGGVVVDAGLGDEAVGELGLEAFPAEAGPEFAGALPVAFVDRQDARLPQDLARFFLKRSLAQQPVTTTGETAALLLRNAWTASQMSRPSSPDSSRRMVLESMAINRGPRESIRDFR